MDQDVREDFVLIEMIGDPNSTELTVLSYGAGQDSTAILFMMIHDESFRNKYLKGQFIVIFADTGNEHPHTYRYLEYVRSVCKQHKIEFYHLSPADGYHSDSWSAGLDGHYARYQVIMSKAMRSKSCTHGLKINPIYNFLSEYVNEHFLHGMSQPLRKIALKDYAIRYGKINVLLGISAEEAGRRIKEYTGDKWMQISVRKLYPLADIEMTRKNCQDKITELGYEVPFPSNCIMCPFASKKEILWLYRTMPGELERWYQYEQAKLNKFAQQQADRGKNNHTVWGGSKSLKDILKEAEEEFGHLTNEELEEYKFSHGHCVVSAY